MATQLINQCGAIGDQHYVWSWSPTQGQVGSPLFQRLYAYKVWTGQPLSEDVPLLPHQLTPNGLQTGR